jgi:hypothetical protein
VHVSTAKKHSTVEVKLSHDMTSSSQLDILYLPRAFHRPSRSEFWPLTAWCSRAGRRGLACDTDAGWSCCTGIRILGDPHHNCWLLTLYTRSSDQQLPGQEPCKKNEENGQWDAHTKTYQTDHWRSPNQIIQVKHILANTDLLLNGQMDLSWTDPQI